MALTFNTTIQYFHWVPQLSSEDAVQTAMIWLYKPSVTLTSITASQFSGTTLQLMMMHHHTKFAYKRLRGSQDIFWTKLVTQKDRQMNIVIPVYLLPLTLLCMGGYNKNICFTDKKRVGWGHHSARVQLSLFPGHNVSRPHSGLHTALPSNKSPQTQFKTRSPAYGTVSQCLHPSWKTSTQKATWQVGVKNKSLLHLCE